MKKHIEQVSYQQFDQHMRALIKQHVAPSLAVTAVRGCDTVAAGGYGHSVLGEEAVASAETVYLYGSMTKLFTATAVMQLRERGLVELDRPVRDYVQDFPISSISGREITVRHLLSHSSGIANPLPIKWVHLADEPAVTLDVLTNQLSDQISASHLRTGFSLRLLQSGRPLRASGRARFGARASRSTFSGTSWMSSICAGQDSRMRTCTIKTSRPGMREASTC